MKKIITIMFVNLMMILFATNVSADNYGVKEVARIRGTNAHEFSEGLAAVEQDGKWGYINNKGEMVIEPQYDAAKDYNFGVACVEKDGEKFFIDKEGKSIIKSQYDYTSDWFFEGLATVKQDEKYGYINTKGEMVIEPQYINASVFSEGLAAVERKQDWKWGYINEQGEMVIEPQYDYAGGFAYGLAYVEKDGEKFLIDKEGKIVIKFQYNNIPLFLEGLAAVEQDGKWGYINNKGEMVIEPQYDETFGFSEGLATVEQDGKWGYINEQGEMVIEPQYDAATGFINDRACVEVDALKAYIDTQGNYITKFEDIEWSSFSEGFLVYNGGLIDKNNRVILSQDFDSIKSVKNGVTLAQKGEELILYDVSEVDLEGTDIETSISQLETENNTLDESGEEKNNYEYTDTETVKIIQQALNDAGYNCGVPDGIAGENTKQAIILYETDKNLIINGIITDELIKFLNVEELVQEAAAQKVLGDFIDRFNECTDSYHDATGIAGNLLSVDMFIPEPGAKDVLLAVSGGRMSIFWDKEDGIINAIYQGNPDKSDAILIDIMSVLYGFNKEIASPDTVIDFCEELIETDKVINSDYTFLFEKIPVVGVKITVAKTY